VRPLPFPSKRYSSSNEKNDDYMRPATRRPGSYAVTS
jgi:hypothetical protein